MSEPIFALDIGSGKVVALVGERDEKGDLRILGHGVSKSLGIRKGVVVNIEKSVDSVKKALDQARETSGYEIEEALVGITGGHIKGEPSRGMTSVSDKRLEVRKWDVRKAMEQAQTIFIPPDREILYVHTNTFILDGQRGIMDPVGMIAVRLEVDVYILTAQATMLRNLEMVLEKAKLVPISFVFQPLSASFAVLTEQERKQGVALVDIGKDTTDLAVWFEGELVHTAVLEIGGDLITGDIAYGLKISRQKAEDLKLRVGVASSRVLSKGMVRGNEKLKIRGGSGMEEESLLERRVFVDIIEARVEELLDFVRDELYRSGVADKLAMGVYLIGGSSLMNGMKETVENMLGLPVTIGIPRGIAGDYDFLRSPAFASSVGLLRIAPVLQAEMEWEDSGGLRGLGDILRHIIGAFKDFWRGGSYAFL